MYILAVDLVVAFASMASGVMPVWSTLRAPPSGGLWLAEMLRLAMVAWCCVWPEWADPVSPSNKLDAAFRTLHLAFSDLRGGGGDGADVEVLDAFPSAGLLASCVAGVLRRVQLDLLLQVGACPPPMIFLRRQGLARFGERHMRRLQRDSFPNRLEQGIQRRSCFFSSSSAAVRRRSFGRRRTWRCSSPQGRVRHFLFLRGVFCKRGTAVPCLDYSSVMCCNLAF